MRRDVYVVSLAPVGDLQRLSEPPDDAEVDAGIAYELLLDDLAERPFAGPLLAGGDREVDVASDGPIAAGILGAQGVFDKEGLERLQLPAQ